MATLNDLRTKGGVIVIAVIAIALVAFLLGDLFGNGGINSSAEDIVVGEINGEEIEYIEFWQRCEELKGMYGPSANVSIEDLSETVWLEYLWEEAYAPSFEEMGMTVTEVELLDIIDQQLLGMAGGDAAYYNYLLEQVQANPGMFPEEALVRDRIMGNFYAMMYYGMGVNSLEVEEAVKSASILSDVKIVSKSYASIPDSVVADPTDAEIKKYYDAHKANKAFQQPASRVVEYVEFYVEPSVDDIALAEREANDLVGEFKLAENPILFAAQASRHSVDTTYFAKNEIAPEYVEYAFGKKKGEVYGPVREGNVITLARLADERTVTKNGRRVKEAQMAVVTYDVIAGDATIQKASDEAEAFLAAAKKSGFNAVAAEQGLNVMYANVGAYDRMVRNMKDSRQLVNWAYSNGKGSVSKVMRLDGNFVVATVSKINKEGCKPLEELSNTIALELRRQAKADWVAEQLAGVTTIEEAAKILDAEVVTIKDVAGNDTSVMGINNPKLMGAIAAADKGVFVGPVRGDLDVYTFVVTDRDEVEVKVEDEELTLDAQLQNHFSYTNPSEVLLSGVEVKDERVKYF